jgi:hypothetical protein
MWKARAFHRVGCRSELSVWCSRSVSFAPRLRLLWPRRRRSSLGDPDHQGGQIEANTREVLERESRCEIEWERVAITAIQARRIDPILKPDRRYRPPRTYEAWETEALGQTRVVALLRSALDALIPEPIDDVRVREDEQREAVARLLDRPTGRNHG